MDEGSVLPQNSGTVTLGPSHTIKVIELTFNYPTKIFNGMDMGTIHYELNYK